MNQATWQTSSDVRAMLEHWASSPSQKPYPQNGFDRRLRLWACGVVRLCWDRLVDEAPCPQCEDGVFMHLSRLHPCYACSGTGRVNRSRNAVEVAERYAEGLATEGEMFAAARALGDPGMCPSALNSAAWMGCAETVDAAEVYTALAFDGSISPAAAASLLRCVAGNLWAPVRLDNNCSFWDGGCGGTGRFIINGETVECPRRCEGKPRWARDPTVLHLARAAVDRANRLESGLLDPNALLRLADALEDAGCSDHAVLTHLRQEWETCGACRGEGWYPGKPAWSESCPACAGERRVRVRHAVGCWCVDLVLRRE